ncbi:TRAP transporter small permease [Microbacterium sp.]|uniref:TRAP transporter small permease n=1 Tax=Microbacterium sp. TaxID=51671 RepID=UPI002CD76571|nr:TRAP transporter small permease [Microbacterium sp.]HWK76302.1 TRAP transporter small permease [Microbacterium sp.]
MTENSEKPGTGSRPIKILEIIGAAVIFVMMLHTLANVVGRFAFNFPVLGTLEIVQYWYMPTIAFLGFIVAKFLNEHIEAPIIFDSLTWGNRRLLVIVNGILAVVTCLLFAYFTFVGQALHGVETGATAGASTVPIWPVMFLLPVVYLILSAQWAIDVLSAARGRIDETDEADQTMATFVSDDMSDSTEAAR